MTTNFKNYVIFTIFIVVPIQQPESIIYFRCYYQIFISHYMGLVQKSNIVVYWLYWGLVLHKGKQLMKCGLAKIVQVLPTKLGLTGTLKIE